MVLLLGGLKCLCERRDYFHEITNNSVVGDFEDGRVGVLVDSHHALLTLDADQMLDGAGDAHGQVELGRDGLA